MPTRKTPREVRHHKKDHPAKASAERGESRASFELPPTAERIAYPFIPMDPEQQKAAQQIPRLAEVAFFQAKEAVGLEIEADPLSLGLIFHFWLRNTVQNNRARLYSVATVLQDEDNVWEYLRSVQPLHGLRIMDYGAANGGFPRALRLLGAEAYGVDVRDLSPTWADKDHPKPYDVMNKRGEPMVVMGRDRLYQPEVRKALDGLDMVISTRLLRTTQAPQHAEMVREHISPLLKPGGLLLTIPELQSDISNLMPVDETFGQFQYTGEYEMPYSVIRKSSDSHWHRPRK